MIFIDYSVTKDCVNPDSYGIICVKCNKCGRFDEAGQEQEHETEGGTNDGR